MKPAELFGIEAFKEHMGTNEKPDTGISAGDLLNADSELLDEAARRYNAAPELVEALRNLLAYANKYSDEMAKIGRGAEQLGELSDSSSVAGMARSALQKAGVA